MPEERKLHRHLRTCSVSDVICEEQHELVVQEDCYWVILLIFRLQSFASQQEKLLKGLMQYTENPKQLDKLKENTAHPVSQI